MRFVKDLAFSFVLDAAYISGRIVGSFLSGYSSRCECGED